MTDNVIEDGKAIEPLALTPAQKKQWEDTVTMMAWTCPGFRHIWYKLLDNNGGDYVAVPTRKVPVAATDARNIMINPDEFFKYNLPERTFIMAHEIVHNVYGDVEFLHRCTAAGSVPMADGTTLPFRNSTMQKAMDYRINALLQESRIGKAPKGALLDKDIPGDTSVIDAYRKVYEEEGPDHPGNGKGGFDIVMAPGTSTGQSAGGAAQQRNQQQWAVAIAQAHQIEKDRSHGKMAGGLSRMFQKLLEPEVDWRDHIKTLINRIGNSGGWNWNAPDEWWTPHEFFQPKPTGKGAGWIVIWGDTSGSRSDAEIASNIAELKGILEDVNPARLTMIWCDAEVTDKSVIELTDASELAGLEPTGGGGTEVDPVFDWIASQMDGPPDLFIGFTDGYLSFPGRPRFPVIWASSTDVKYPYGDVVRVMQTGAAQP